MVQPIAIWVLAVSLLVFILLFKVIRGIYNHSKFGKRHKIIEMASDEEIFYCPGDKEYWNDARK